MGSTAEESITPGREASTSRPGVWLTEAMLVAMAVIWGVNFSVVKFGTTLVDPLAYNGVRVALAATLLSGIVLLGKTPLPPRRTMLALLGLGVLGNGVYQFFFVEGIAHTRASDTALVVAATPAFIAIIGRVRGVERVNLRGAIGIALSLVGIGLVVLSTAESSDARSSLTGDLLVLVGSMAWAVYTVLLKPYTERVSGLQLSALTMTGGALTLLVIAAPAIAHAPWSSVTAIGWSALVYSGVFALVIAYYFWYHGVRVLGPTRTAMYSNLQPVIAVLMAWVLLHETPTPWQILGAVSIMSGLLLTRP
jgi:drug/metabolite transporter (DMT)-like permease